MNLPDDYDITLDDNDDDDNDDDDDDDDKDGDEYDDDDDDDDDADDDDEYDDDKNGDENDGGKIDPKLLYPYLDQYVKDCLKMNLSIKSIMQPVLPDHKEIKLPDVNIQYLCLIDDLCKLMESCDPGVFIDKCGSLMASYNLNITLFSDEVLKDFSEYDNASIMMRYLMCYCSWCDLSIVLKLLEICDYPDGIRLLQKFKHMVDFSKSFTEHPISFPNSLLIPSDASHFAVMVTIYEPEFFPISLKHVEVIKPLLTEKCEITFISCQLLGVAIDSQTFHWLIPKSLAPFIASKIQENYDYFQRNGIKRSFIYSFFADDILSSAVFSIDSNVEKVCKIYYV